MVVLVVLVVLVVVVVVAAIGNYLIILGRIFRGVGVFNDFSEIF
jgi:hypothetical protein